MKKFIGSVVRVNGSKTAHVQVQSEWMHPKYGKKITVSRVFACHDAVGCGVGQTVTIRETRPMSATKFFAVENILTKSGVVEEKKVVEEKVATLATKVKTATKEVKPKEKKKTVKAK